MIIHTVMSPHTIFNEQGLSDSKYKEIEYKGIKVQVDMIYPETCILNRIFTTDVQLYLNPDFQPGTKITLLSPTNQKGM